MATYQIRAMSVGEILDGTFTIYRRYFGPLIGIAITCYGAPAVLGVYVQLRGGVIFAPGLWGLAMLLQAIGGLIAAGATVKVVSDAFLGREPVMGDALHFALGKIWRILIAGIAKYILVFLASLLLLIPGVIVACGYAVVVQVVVLEELASPTDALGRSWSLTKGSKGRAFVLGVVTFAILLIPAFVAGALVAFFQGAFVLATLVQLLVYPIFGCALTLFYYDLRVRREAFDLEHLSRQLGLGAEPAGA